MKLSDFETPDPACAADFYPEFLTFNEERIPGWVAAKAYERWRFELYRGSHPRLAMLIQFVLADNNLTQVEQRIGIGLALKIIRRVKRKSLMPLRKELKAWSDQAMRSSN